MGHGFLDWFIWYCNPPESRKILVLLINFRQIIKSVVAKVEKDQSNNPKALKVYDVSTSGQ
jgi:hypothetical protein